MPLASGLGIHDDTKHKGSAKRALAGGVAPLDVGSKVPIANIPDTVPTGVLLPYCAAVAPIGYLLCDGAAISRTTYAALFAVIGVAYGVGDGSTTFNLPDMQGAIPVGIGGSGVTALGDTGGEQTHTLITSEIPPHTHTVYGTLNCEAGATRRQLAAATSSDVASASTGGGGAHENMQPYIATEYIIKI